MEKIKRFDSYSLKSLRRVIEEKINSELDEIGVHIKIGSINYTELNASAKIELSLKNEDGEIVTRKELKFKSEAKDPYSPLHLAGFNEDHLGSTFVFKNKTYTIVGFNPRSYKYPILASLPDGKHYKFGISHVARMMNLSKNSIV